MCSLSLILILIVILILMLLVILLVIILLILALRIVLLSTHILNAHLRMVLSIRRELVLSLILLHLVVLVLILLLVHLHLSHILRLIWIHLHVHLIDRVLMLNVILTLVILILLKVAHWLLVVLLRVHILGLVLVIKSLLVWLGPIREIKGLILLSLRVRYSLLRSSRHCSLLFLKSLILNNLMLLFALPLDPFFLGFLWTNHHNLIDLVDELLNSIIVAKFTCPVWLTCKVVVPVRKMFLNVLLPGENSHLFHIILENTGVLKLVLLFPKLLCLSDLALQSLEVRILLRLHDYGVLQIRLVLLFRLKVLNFNRYVSTIFFSQPILFSDLVKRQFTALNIFDNIGVKLLFVLINFG